MAITNLFQSIVVINFSDYSNRTYQSARSDSFYGDFGVMGSRMNSALFNLIMALMMKLFFTIFTFGLKVGPRCLLEFV